MAWTPVRVGLGLVAALAVAVGPATADDAPGTVRVSAVVADTAGIAVDASGGFAGSASSVRVTVTRERYGQTEIITVVP